MHRRRLILAVLLTSSAAATPAAAAPPPAGGLTQLAPPRACFSTAAAGGCSALATGISQASGLAVTADGLGVFSVGTNGGGAAFDRATDGVLTSRPTTPSGNVIAAAPDNTGLVTGERDTGSSLGGVQTYTRDPATGTLGLGAHVADSCGASACASDNGLYDVEGVAYSPDGKSVYAASHAGGASTASILGGAVVAFARNPTNQVISLIQCVPRLQTTSGVCHSSPAAEGLEGAEGIVVSPDGAFVYVTGSFDSAVTGFNRTVSGAGLGKLGAQATCVTSKPATNACLSAPGLSSAAGLAISPDGRDLYVAARNGGVVTLRRDLVSGVLQETECASQAGGGGCSADPGLIAQPRAVAVSPDGSTVFVAGGNGADGFVRAYSRDGVSGRLTPLNCLSSTGTAPCPAGAGLKNAQDVIVAPDGRNVYTSSGLGPDGKGAISAFAVQHAPSCAAASVTTANATAVLLPLSCTDADGDLLTRTVTGVPAHGTLGAIDDAAGAVRYQPAAGYAGDDAVRFTASDGTNATPATQVAIVVGAPSAGPKPPETGPTTTTTSPTTTMTTTTGPTPSPSLVLSVAPVAGQALPTVGKRGLRVRVSCTVACSTRLTLTLARTEARRLHLGARALTAASGTASLSAGTARTVTLRLTAGLKAKARSAARARFTLKVVAAAAGQKPATRSSSVALKR